MTCEKILVTILGRECVIFDTFHENHTWQILIGLNYDN